MNETYTAGPHADQMFLFFVHKTSIYDMRFTFDVQYNDRDRHQISLLNIKPI